LGRKMFTKFHVYAGSEHKHQGQKPIELPAYLTDRQ